MDQYPKTPSSGGKRSVGGQFPSSPRRMTSGSTEAPRLETKLDSTSFGDMFSGFEPSKATDPEVLSPTAPKLATTLLPPPPSLRSSSDSPTGYNSTNVPIRKVAARVENLTPLPPAKSYNPATVTPKVQGMVKEKVQTFNTYLQSQAQPPSQNMYSTDATGGAERWAGRPSEEVLISPLSEESTRSISPRQSRNLTHSTPNTSHTSSHARNDSLSAPPRNTRLPRTSTGDLGLKRSSAVMKRNSIPTDDEDAALVMKNVQRGHGNHSSSMGGPRGIPDRMKDRDSGWEENVASGSSSVNSLRDNSSASSRDTGNTSVTSPRSPAASRSNTDENFATVKMINSTESTNKSKERAAVELYDGEAGSDTEFDSSISAAAALAAKYEDDSTQRAREEPKKVMTRAQFEKYRQQQDEERKLRGKSKSDTESDDDSEEDYDSDTERNKEAIRQRQKQEAHLSVYRQQMMKISGTTSSTEALNGPMAAPMLSLNNSMPQLSLSTPEPASDEDEEVPLGILMAHGFPNRNRPPTRLSTVNSSSQPNLRGTAQQHGEGMGGRLPVFARNLPADPYNFGAGLVNPVNRMPVGMGAGNTGLGGGTGSVAGGSVYGGGGSVYGGHPGGLIGEIAMAEGMKAARRHSPSGFTRPNTGNRTPGSGGGMLGLGGGMPAGMSAGMPVGMGMMGMPMGMQQQPQMSMPMVMPQQPPMMGIDPSQMQMQMQQMMQMQMQWMQQMQAQQQAQQQMMQGGLNTPVMGLPRPNSIAIPQATPQNVAPMQQRTMSMVDPILGSFGAYQSLPGYAPSVTPSMMGPMNPGYTPSIAPSERSTIGLPSRYRPVSQVPQAAAGNSSRTSTMTSNMALNWQQQHQKPMGGSQLKVATTKADDDDDDDSAWEELERKKREKKDSWKKKKDLKSMLSFGSSTAAVTSS